MFSILKNELHEELTLNILPFWMNLIDKENGGFYGKVDGFNLIHKDACKGGILHARILWTFSAAYRVLKEDTYLQTANTALKYITRKFVDNEFGGVYWKLDDKGNPVDTKKQIYNLAFNIYALSEYYLATGHKAACDLAVNLFNLIEKYSFDRVNNGYFEAFTRDWQTIDDMRLSDKDANEKKTMNTHLHLLEAYTNLYRIWKSDELRNQLINLIKIFTDKMIDKKNNHLGLFYDESWHLKTEIISFGHEIETAWLIHEAAEVADDPELTVLVGQLVCPLVDAALEGYTDGNGLAYEFEAKDNRFDNERHWWVQAEAVVGAMKAYEISGNEKYLNISFNVWQYIKSQLIDKQSGEWYWSRLDNGEINLQQDKAGFWKCPYHNGRMCLEIMKSDAVQRF